PAPQVVANAQPVAEYAFGVLNRAVVDPVAGVIAGRARFVGLPSEHEVALLQAEHGAVEVVHRFAVVFPRLDDLLHRLGERVDVVEADVPQLHVVLDFLQLDLQAHRVPEGAVGVWEPPEEVDVLRRRAGHHLTSAGEDVHLDQDLVRQTIAEARGLHAQTGDRPPPGNRLQLRDDGRAVTVGQDGIHQVLVGAHSLHVGGSGHRVDGDHRTAAGDVQARCGRLVAAAEEVGGFLRQADVLPWRDGRVAGPQFLHRLLVREPTNRLQFARIEAVADT